MSFFSANEARDMKGKKKKSEFFFPDKKINSLQLNPYILFHHFSHFHVTKKPPKTFNGLTFVELALL